MRYFYIHLTGLYNNGNPFLVDMEWKSEGFFNKKAVEQYVKDYYLEHHKRNVASVYISSMFEMTEKEYIEFTAK